MADPIPVITPETQSKIAEWRRKVADGSITTEELKEAVRYLRQDRVAAAQTSKIARTKKAPVNGDDLLKGLLDF